MSLQVAQEPVWPVHYTGRGVHGASLTCDRLHLARVATRCPQPPDPGGSRGEPFATSLTHS